MANNHDYVALDWVQGEIVTTLEEAQAALEAYVGQPEDKSRLRFCLNHLHQVHGTLQMVEFYGAAVLAEEMEKLAEAILKNTVSSQDEALEVLMESMLQLPNYLERLKQSRRDLPMVLMPTLNDLRAARGEALLTSNSLFNPDLGHARRPATNNQTARMSDPRTVVQLRKVRQMYQFALVGLIREKEIATNLDFMHKSLHYLEGLTKGTLHEQFWRIATGLIDAFEHKQFTLSIAIKSLLRAVDLRIKKMIEEPQTILSQKLPEDTLKNLLYYIACSAPVTERIKTIREDYRLDEALPHDSAIAEERAKLSGPDKSAITSVVLALNEELARIKDQLDLFVRASFKDIQDLLGMLPSLTQIGNTLTILGLGQPRKLIQELVSRLESLSNSNQPPSDDALMHMAGILLQVENQLLKMGTQSGSAAGKASEQNGFIPQDQLADAHEAVIREARNGIEQAKLAIVEFIGSQWDLSHIEKVPEHLRSIEGGLRIIPLHKAASMMGACADFIQKTLIDQGKTPDWSQLDTLADAVTSIEYYLERMTEGGDGNETILQVAEDSLKRLAEDNTGSITGIASVEPQLASEKSTDHDLIDDEIREIFVEEAGEVIASMLSNFPIWHENPFDKPSLVDLRRAFHTLKGSGRLVGATEIGELSWSIENLLNRVIDGTLEPGLGVFELVETTIHKIPALIDGFSSGKSLEPLQDIIDAANNLANTRSKAVDRPADSGMPNELAAPGFAGKEESAPPSPPQLITLDTPAEEVLLPAAAPLQAAPLQAAPLQAAPDSENASEDVITGLASSAEVEQDIQEQAAPQPATPQPAAPSFSSSRDPVPASSSLADDDLIDAEIIEIFVEESTEVLATISQYLPMFLNNFDHAQARTEVRRAFHTLKGSGRMVGAKTVGELSWSVENLLNRILDNTVSMSFEIGNLISTVVELLPDLVKDFELRRPPTHEVSALIEYAHGIAKGELPSTAPVPGQATIVTAASESPFVEAEQARAETFIPASIAAADDDSELDIPDLPMDQQITLAEYNEETGIDPTLRDIFRSETETHLQTLRSFVAKARRDHNTRINDDVSRALHTLKGSANTAAVGPIAEIVIPTEKLFKEIRLAGLRVDESLAALLDETVELTTQGLAQLVSHPQRRLQGAADYLQRLAALSAEKLDAIQDEARLQESYAPDTQLLNLFLTEGIDILLDAERILDEWSHQGVSAPEQHMLVTELQTLAQGAQLAGLDDVRQLSSALEKAYRDIETHHRMVSADFFEVAKEAHEQLINMMDQVAAGLATHIDIKLLAELHDAVAALPQIEPESKPEKRHEAFVEEAFIEEAVAEDSAEEADTLASTDDDSTDTDEMVALKPSTWREEEDEDDDIANIFVEEAEDLIHSSADTLSRWSGDRINLPLVHSLQRDFHTLKGGARLAGQPAIADLAHELENLFEAITHDRIRVSDEVINLSLAGHDGLAGMVVDLRNDGRSKPAPELIGSVHAFITRAISGETEVSAESEDDHIIGVDHAGELQLDDLDMETVELFLEEADEIIHRTGETLNNWSEELEDISQIPSLQRDLHTLKGGARLAAIKVVGDLAHEMETVFEQMTQGRLRATAPVVELLLQCHDRLAHMLEAIKANDPLPGGDDLIEKLLSFASAHQDILIEDLSVSDTARDEADMEAQTETEAQAESEAGAEAEAKAETETDHITQTASKAATKIPEENWFTPSDSDPELMELFLTEAQELTNETASQLHAWHANPEDPAAMRSLLRALHTLKGGARLAEIRPIGDLSHALETLLEALVGGNIKPNADIVALTHSANDRLVEMLDAVAAGRPILSATAIIHQISSLTEHDEIEPAEMAEVGDTAGERLQKVFITEARQALANMVGGFDQWQMGVAGATATIINEAEKLSGASSLAGIGGISRLADTLSRCLEREQPSATDAAQAPALTERTLRALSHMLDQVELRQEPELPVDLLEDLSHTFATPESSLNLMDIDEDILQVFFEEADELLGGLQRAFDDWRRDGEHMEHAAIMQRQLHTLKGGARLATLTSIGDVAQQMEALVKDALDHKRELNATLQADLGQLFDRLQQSIGSVKEAVKQQAIIEKDRAAKAVEAALPDRENRSASEKVVQLQREQAVAPAKSAPAQPAPDSARQAPRAQTGDTVRVTAGLLDSLVNLAGETSITRGLVEQQISDFSHTLSEMQATIERLREQLRRMDIETEAQVLFRMEKESGPTYEDFDPLEMDRYSSIQQLSRALSESASDLTDLRETLLERSRGAETLLLQQARINTELQEGLMKTRMVPFTSIVPRLRRIVRQVATELGKQANFEVYNPEGELDRTVLERMVAPFEHMLRNAMDHGIESPEKRRQAGKPEAGTITLSLNREGGDVVIVLSDDGAGINVDAVRKKAIKQGLIDSYTAIADQDILQFIFKAGFSTAEKVTQLSGRGVGMDVVSSEIKQLGGRVSIHSETGKGTRFVIHLPFTVSVNRALMVSTGEDYYAIPLNTIEGIVRVSTYELEEYYKPGAPLYEYAGQSYRLQYLGNLLHSENHPILQGQPLPLPVILVRGGDQPLALQVNNLMGSREIVVKGLGKQFAGVRGVSGATILGDGSVVVILDLPAMLRNEFSPQEKLAAKASESRVAVGPRTVMVVDDSVTVRKVTTRLLERHGMEVITAKDGVDAIALLQDYKPDIMLLDIEMPRMDGFEVASLVRHDKRLAEVPIIMITSRTGQKHRERALSIGVNEYMGKPFQEKNLLEAIDRLTVGK
jgi:chemosensory pili system protein ChpA (sensor histidine kinase/response regulator)